MDPIFAFLLATFNPNIAEQRVLSGEEELNLLEKAEEKLRSACEMRRGDMAERMALGEVLTTHAERASTLGIAPSQVTSYPLSPSPPLALSLPLPPFLTSAIPRS